MTERDWNFVLGPLGDPLADIMDWMLPPYPKCMPERQREGRIDHSEQTNNAERECETINKKELAEKLEKIIHS